MYPMKLKPVYDKTIWANDRLTTMRGMEEKGLGTCWEISAHPHAKNVILNGEYAGKTLDELIQADPQSILGEKQLHQMLRLAYLDAREDLSIQVHPYDEYARAHENDEGKTESWYILEADKGATLVAGTTASDLSLIHILCVHTAFDVQQTGKNPLDELMIVNRVITHAKSAVAGGVKLATIDAIASEGAAVVVVGGAICNAKDRAAAAKEMKQHLK